MSGGYDVIVIDCGSSSEHFTGAGAVAGNTDVAVTSEKAVDGRYWTGRDTQTSASVKPADSTVFWLNLVPVW